MFTIKLTQQDKHDTILVWALHISKSQSFNKERTKNQAKQTNKHVQIEAKKLIKTKYSIRQSLKQGSLAVGAAWHVFACWDKEA